MLRIVLQEPSKHLRAALITLCAAFNSGAWAQEGMPTGPQHLPVIGLSAGMHLIKAEIAQAPREHAIGLMFRTEMGTNEGMLFAFPQAGKQCFWMKNTLIPLAVAFVDDQGVIANLDEMLPQTENPHCSTKPVRFVLEMNKGWFSKRGIKAGMKLGGEPFSGAR
jgi:uncharacterized membrane protein (UPF0127 family)